MKSTDRLRGWLKIALWFVPSAYAGNFLYALFTDQSGGTFGDTFGAANALFSGTALMMLVLAVILQREELELVKEERNDTRRLLEGQEGLNRAQQAAIKRQLFQQSFYSHFQIALQERERLYSKINPADSNSSTLIIESYRSAANVINRLANGESVPYGDVNKERAYRAFFYVNTLVDLSAKIDSHEISPEERSGYLQMIFSVLDYETFTCAAFFTTTTVIEKLQPNQYLRFYNEYQVEAGLQPVVRTNMQAILEKYWQP